MPNFSSPPSSRAASAVKLSAALYLVISTAIIVCASRERARRPQRRDSVTDGLTRAVGRNVPSIWQGMVGVIASLEGYYGADSRNPRRVLFFLVALVPCVAVSFVLGVLAVTGNDILVNCDSGQQVTLVTNNNTHTSVTAQNNFDSCSTSFKLYGYVEILGGASLGLVLVIVVATSYRPLQRESKELGEQQDAMEAMSLKGYGGPDKAVAVLQA